MADMLDQPVADLVLMAEATGKIMEEESEQAKRSTDID